MTQRDLDETLRRMADTKVNRRGFLAAAGLSATAAFLAACKAGGSSSAAPVASSAASEATSAAASVAASEAVVDSFPPAGPVEKQLFMYNWSQYISPKNIDAYKEVRHHQVPVRRLRQQRGPDRQAPGRRHGLRHRLPDRRVRAGHGPGRLRPEARQVAASEPRQHRRPSSRACGGIRTTNTSSPRTSGRRASSTARR